VQDENSPPAPRRAAQPSPAALSTTPRRAHGPGGSSGGSPSPRPHSRPRRPGAPQPLPQAPGRAQRYGWVSGQRRTRPSPRQALRAPAPPHLTAASARRPPAAASPHASATSGIRHFRARPTAPLTPPAGDHREESGRKESARRMRGGSWLHSLGSSGGERSAHAPSSAGRMRSVHSLP